MVEPVGSHPPRYSSLGALKADYEQHGPAILRGGNQVAIAGVIYLVDLFHARVSSSDPAPLSPSASRDERADYLRSLMRNFFARDVQQNTQELHQLFFAHQLPGSRPRAATYPMADDVNLLHASQARRTSLSEPSSEALPTFIRSIQTLGGAAYALDLMQQRADTSLEAKQALSQRVYEILHQDMNVTTVWDLAAVVGGLRPEEFEILRPLLHQYLCQVEAELQTAKIAGSNPNKEAICEALAQHAGFQSQVGGAYIANAVNYLRTPFLSVGIPTPDQAVLCDVLGCAPQDLRVDINQALSAEQLANINQVIQGAKHRSLPERLTATATANAMAETAMQQDHPHQADILRKFDDTIKAISTTMVSNLLAQLTGDDYATLQNALARYLAGQQLTEMTQSATSFVGLYETLDKIEQYCFATGIPPELSIDLLTTGDAIRNEPPNDRTLGFAVELLNQLRPADQQVDPRVQQLQVSALKTAIANQMATQIEQRVDVMAANARPELEALSIETRYTPGAMITEAKTIAGVIRMVTGAADTTSTESSTSTQF